MVLDCEALCASEEEEADEDVEAAGAGAGAGCGALLALCDALVCESMLCCSVCENGSALAAFGADALGALLEDESKSEEINESGDMVGPVYPVSLVNSGQDRLFV